MALFPSFNLKNSYQQLPDLSLTVTPVDQGQALIDPKRGVITVLNEVGFFIFELLKKKHSAEQLIQKVEKQFTTTNGANIKKDVLFFIRDLEKKRLIQKVA